ncbi:G-patch domain and KOW motifs-containing protein T54-like [Channa argus]|uniref:G-patch domain and KOW motifs-containing protein n=1 Tax=Channa argus TaxID=215402 RepID=A0A6G1Q3S8_CHAAH|nr:G-patch domain and KOW motifs-containing protein T54-like [Channa argus]
MASYGEDAAASKCSTLEDQGDRKTTAVSFGFTKTVSKFNPPAGDFVLNEDDRDYLTGIDGNELQSSKPSEKPKELIIPLIQKNRWHRLDRAAQCEGTKTQETTQDGDSVESQAVKELIEGVYACVCTARNVKPIEHQLRPKGLGLGADRSAIKDLEPSKHRRPPKPGEEQEKEEELVMGPGGCVLVESGAHRELYGKIEGIDPDNARVVIKLAIGGKTVTVSQYAVKLVGRKEYEKYSKDLSRLSKAHKDKEKQKEKEREREKELQRREEKGRRSNGDKVKHNASERDEKDERKRKHRESSQEREKPPVKEARRLPAPPSWLQRDLKVRFVDKAFKGGRYYNSKMCVEDVLTPTTCVCRTEEGRLLDDVKQDMLETIVPKSECDSVMVVLGEHKGQVGRILQRDKNKCRAMVQLDRYEEKVFTMDYDSICHYLGAADH